MVEEVAHEVHCGGRCLGRGRDAARGAFGRRCRWSDRDSKRYRVTPQARVPGALTTGASFISQLAVDACHRVDLIEAVHQVS